MTDNDSHRLLTAVLQAEAETLHRIICSYALKMGAATAADVQAIADEILSETATAAIVNADSFDTSRRPFPWLLGIALNRIRRRVTQQRNRNQREIAIRDLLPTLQEQYGDDELFDRFASWVNQPGPLEMIEMRERLAPLLATLSEDDRQLLNLCIVEELNSQAVAAQMGINAATVRVRLHRILKQLRRRAQLQDVEGKQT